MSFIDLKRAQVHMIVCTAHVRMQFCEFIFTARFARGTEAAENNYFSIAVERTTMEKYSVPLKSGQDGNA